MTYIKRLLVWLFHEDREMMELNRVIAEYALENSRTFWEAMWLDYKVHLILHFHMMGKVLPRWLRG